MIFLHNNEEIVVAAIVVLKVVIQAVATAPIVSARINLKLSIVLFLIHHNPHMVQNHLTIIQMINQFLLVLMAKPEIKHTTIRLGLLTKETKVNYNKIG